MVLAARSRPIPDRGLPVDVAVVEFLGFVHTTAVNKVAGLSEEQARRAPLETSPAMSLLGLLKHMTAVLRQHIQCHIGESELPSLWRADDHDFEFRLTDGDTVARVVGAFDAEYERSVETLEGVAFDRLATTYGQPNTVGRVLVDVLQELARHLGQMDIVREVVDGTTGE
jgi:hypothetical protein